MPIPLLLTAFLLVQAVISVRTELVTVPVIVTDGRGRHVSGLRQDDFRVYEDGRPQPIAVFHHGDAPVTLGLVVDRSQSMRPKTPAVRAAVSALLRANRPDDELFAVGFNDRVSLALPDGRPFTSDATTLERAVSAVPTGGRTALYDGVVEALRHLQLGPTKKSVLIVISDGGDNASRATYAQVRALARQSQAVIYAIGLLRVSQIAEEEEDAGLLERLCKDTGGVAYFPRSVDEVAAVSLQIAADLRQQYTLGFAPGTPSVRGAFRRIEVKVSAAHRGRLHVRARSGYTQEGKDRP